MGLQVRSFTVDEEKADVFQLNARGPAPWYGQPDSMDSIPESIADALRLLFGHRGVFEDADGTMTTVEVKVDNVDNVDVEPKKRSLNDDDVWKAKRLKTVQPTVQPTVEPTYQLPTAMNNIDLSPYLSDSESDWPPILIGWHMVISQSNIIPRRDTLMPFAASKSASFPELFFGDAIRREKLKTLISQPNVSIVVPTQRMPGDKMDVKSQARSIVWMCEEWLGIEQSKITLIVVPAMPSSLNWHQMSTSAMKEKDPTGSVWRPRTKMRQEVMPVVYEKLSAAEPSEYASTLPFSGEFVAAADKDGGARVRKMTIAQYKESELNGRSPYIDVVVTDDRSDIEYRPATCRTIRDAAQVLMLATAAHRLVNADIVQRCPREVVPGSDKFNQDHFTTCRADEFDQDNYVRHDARVNQTIKDVLAAAVDRQFITEVKRKKMSLALKLDSKKTFNFSKPSWDGEYMRLVKSLFVYVATYQVLGERCVNGTIIVDQDAVTVINAEGECEITQMPVHAGERITMSEQVVDEGLRLILGSSPPRPLYDVRFFNSGNAQLEGQIHDRMLSSQASAAHNVLTGRLGDGAGGKGREHRRAAQQV